MTREMTACPGLALAHLQAIVQGVLEPGNCPKALVGSSTVLLNKFICFLKCRVLHKRCWIELQGAINTELNSEGCEISDVEEAIHIGLCCRRNFQVIRIPCLHHARNIPSPEQSL